MENTNSKDEGTTDAKEPVKLVSLETLLGIALRRTIYSLDREDAEELAEFKIGVSNPHPRNPLLSPELPEVDVLHKVDMPPKPPVPPELPSVYLQSNNRNTNAEDQDYFYTG